LNFVEKSVEALDSLQGTTKVNPGLQE